MKKLSHLLTLLLAMFISFSSEAQSTLDTTGTILHADARLAVLVKKSKEVKLGVIRSGKGFRVQIYSGTDRNKASQIRVDFMKRFPGTRSYLTYISPQYRVKVGDFVDRSDAQRLYNSLRNIYNPSIIVPDIVEINTLKNERFH